MFRNNQVLNVSNGFQISVVASASLVDNTIRSASTVIYFGPRAVSLNADGNVASQYRSLMGRDGSGTLAQANNSWAR